MTEARLQGLLDELESACAAEHAAAARVQQLVRELHDLDALPVGFRTLASTLSFYGGFTPAEARARCQPLAIEPVPELEALVEGGHISVGLARAGVNAINPPTAPPSSTSSRVPPRLKPSARSRPPAPPAASKKPRNQRRVLRLRYQTLGSV
jgi:hypothetical protein